MEHRRFRTWSPKLVITTAAIVTGVVGAPIARADVGADLGAPSQAGVAAAAALADAVAVPAVTLSENPVPAVPLPPESLPPVSPAPEEALQPVTPNEGSGAVVPSPAERPPPTSVTASSAPPPSPADPSAGGAPPPESPQAEPPDWYQNQGVQDMPQILADGTHAEQQGTGDPFTAAEPMTSEQPQASSPPGAIQLGPVNIQISIRIASPGDNGSVTQVNAVVTAAPGSSAPLAITPTLSEARRNRAISVVISPGTRSTGPATIGLRMQTATRTTVAAESHRLPAVAATSHCLSACV